MSAVDYTDLFALGLGLDFAGAAMLARGLLTRPAQAMTRMLQGGNSFARFNVRDAEDYADGRTGVAALCLGFGLQAVGYVIQIGGAHADTAGWRARIVAAACAVMGCLIALAVGRASRWPLIRRFLIEVARWDQSERHDQPDAAELLDYGVMLGRQSQEERWELYANDLAGYARRVWKTDARVAR